MRAASEIIFPLKINDIIVLWHCLGRCRPCIILKRSNTISENYTIKILHHSFTRLQKNSRSSDYM